MQLGQGTDGAFFAGISVEMNGAPACGNRGLDITDGVIANQRDLLRPEAELPLNGAKKPRVWLRIANLR